MSPISSQAFGSVARPLSLSDKVAEQLTEAIVSRQLAVGARMPSERELSDSFKVSRTVIREAVRSLAARGLVRVTSGRGVEVSGVGSDNVTASMRLLIRGRGKVEYRKVHEVRAALEVQTAGLAAQRAAPEDLEHLARICRDHRRSLDASDMATASELDYQFHRELTRVADNELLLAMLDSISDILREVRVQTQNLPHVGEDGLRAHERILKAVRASKPDLAREAMATHLAEAERVWAGVEGSNGSKTAAKSRKDRPALRDEDADQRNA